MRPDKAPKPSRIKKIVQAVIEIEQSKQIPLFDLWETNDIGFIPSQLILTTLPHSDPGDVPAWGRSNGDISLTITPLFTVKRLNGKQQITSRGIPYGMVPRDLLVWLTAEVKQNQQRRIHLGESMNAFLADLGYHTTGGKRGDITRVREQLIRLVTSRIAFHYEGPFRNDKDNLVMGEMFEDLSIARRVQLWWEPVDEKNLADNLANGYLELTEAMFEAMLHHGVPLDKRILRQMRSPLGFDMYCWLARKTYGLKQPVVLSWKQLHEQLGANYSNMTNFANKVKAVLDQLRVLWPDLDIEYGNRLPGRLRLYPSNPSVPPKIG